MNPIPLQSIFAMPFAALPLGLTPESNAALQSFLSQQATEASRDPAFSADALCFRSRETLFDSAHESIAMLRTEMLAGLCAVVMSANRYSEAEFDALRVQVRARLAVVRPNGHLPALSLPLASWCALYCVAAPEPTAARADSATLRLYETRLGAMFMDASNWQLRPPFSPGHHVWRPVAGHMAVFPASIMHEIALNRGDRDLILVQMRARFSASGQELPAW